MKRFDPDPSFGAPGTTKTDHAEGTDTEKSVELKGAGTPLPQGVKLPPGIHTDGNGNSIEVFKDGTYKDVPKEAKTQETSKNASPTPEPEKDPFTSQIPPTKGDIYSDVRLNPLRGVGEALGKYAANRSQDSQERERLDKVAENALRKAGWHYYAGEYWSKDWSKRYKTVRGAAENIDK
jgi:hypothetical protein